MKPFLPVVNGNLRKHRARRRSDAVVAVIDQLERRRFLSGTFTPIASFNGVDGANPIAVVQDSSGNQFGIADNTYASPGANAGPGVLFEIPANTGTINDLYTFGVPNVGSTPLTPTSLIIDSSGNLYGASPSPTRGMPGTVIEFPVGTTTPITLATFATTDTEQLTAVDSAGNLYGIDNSSEIFEVVKNSGTVTPLTDAGNQLQQQVVDLRLGPDGNLYGVSSLGGDTVADLFEITPANGHLQLLAPFDPTTSGDTPLGLTFDSSGNIWGFCQNGGPDGDGTYASGSGTVWEFPLPVTSANPTISYICSITNSLVGNTITCRPAFGTSGNLYGITENGGANGNGTIFDLPAGGTTLTDLYDWGAGATDPDLPEGFITNSSGFAPDTTTSAMTTSTADGVLSVRQTTPAVTNSQSAAGPAEFGSRDPAAKAGTSAAADGAIGRVNGNPAVVPPLPPLDPGAPLKRFLDGIKSRMQEERSLKTLSDVMAIQHAVMNGQPLPSEAVQLADPQATADTSRSSQLAQIGQMIAEANRELGVASPLLGKYTGVYDRYTKEGTTIAGLNSQLATQSNLAKQAAIQKKITADVAVQAVLLIECTTTYTALNNELDEIETLEANTTAALAALPAPFAQLTEAITSVPALINPGKKGTAVVTVTNSGNVPVTLSFQMVLSARPQGTTGSADITLSTDTIKLHRLKPNVPIAERLSFLIPKTFPAGTYSLVAVPVISSTLTGTAIPVVSTGTFTVP